MGIRGLLERLFGRPEGASPAQPAAAAGTPAAGSTFSLAYFRKVESAVMESPAFRKAIEGLSADFGIEHPSRMIVIRIRDERVEMLEFPPGSPQGETEAGIWISEEGWRLLTTGTKPPKLLVTRRLKLKGQYFKYRRYLNAVMMVLDVIQAGVGSGGVEGAGAPAPYPAYAPAVDSPPPPATVPDETVRNKPRSSTLFEDTGIPIGVIRLSILRGIGIADTELREKPFIAIVNSLSDLNPGHKHLRQLAEAVREGVLAAGGLPFELDVPAACDGIANGNDGMRFILPQRDLIADMVETHVRSQWFDGMVTISSCDKINPGMLMAAARLDIPTVCVPGGPNAMAIRFRPEARTRGIDQKGYDDILRKLDTATCATCGACELIATANTIQSLMEALGMALPRAASAPAFSSEKLALARESGKRAVDLVRQDVRPSAIMTREAFENAIVVDLAIGGSTNSTLHLPAIAAELGIDVGLEAFNRWNTVVPTVVGISPNGSHGIVDLYMAGGIPALMKRVASNLHRDCLTVSGKTIGEICDEAVVDDEEVIPPRERPFFAEGGTAVLFGSLAPDGAVVKQSSVAKDMLVFEGTAIVCEGEREALEALQQDRVKQGHVLVIRYEGPRGAPGMPELLSITVLIEVLGLDRVALVTDGRFSGATHGPCVGHVSPEAFEGGPIALIQDGDQIRIDIPGRSISLAVPDEELAARRAAWKPVVRPVARGYLERYRRQVSSAARGAILRA